MREYINTAYYLEGNLIYKKQGDKYRIFCMRCQKYETVSKEQLKQIQASRICPMCYDHIIPTTILEHRFVWYIADETYNGYRVFIDFEFGKKPKETVEHVVRYLGNNQVEARYIVANMYSGFYYDPSKYNWKRRNIQTYLWRFCSLRYGFDSKPLTKKEYIYRTLFDEGYTQEDVDRMFKSNQRKIIQDNLLNARQMEYVAAFDLKSYKEVYKYRTYMRKNKVKTGRVLNVHYLDYLYRNKIRLGDFYDYMDECEVLGFKLDKPKDFQYRHQKLAEMAVEKRNQAREEAIKKRYAQLMKKAYSDGDIVIRPFKDGNELRKCGKTLHNCIATYARSYANKSTDLYCLYKNGKMKVAIEVCQKILEQARTDHNGDCPPRYMKHIRKWCAENKFALE